ncbi:MAG: hypothetical protein IH624_11870 [Phycisphaerae bacterium]|nr:hypothetical protein [Phycisphaerae bacterium]
MKRPLRHHGFSLTEVLLAAGILMIGFLMICGTLPVGIHLTAQGTERTIAAVVADEAFAKVQLFGVGDVHGWNSPPAGQTVGVDPNLASVDFQYLWGRHRGVDLANRMFTGDNQFAYPSTDISPDVKKYYWSALLRYEGNVLGDDMFQVTVFVSRNTGGAVQYPLFDDRVGLVPAQSSFPRPVPVAVEAYNPPPPPTDPLLPAWTCDKIWILGNPLGPEQRLITEGSILVDDRTGQIMYVLERRFLGANVDDPPVIFLKGNVFEVDLDGDGNPDSMRYVWVVPPAVGGGRYPGVSVDQRVIKFK